MARVGFWGSVAAGWAIMAVGVVGILSDRVDTRPADLARFLVGGALVHDLLVAPALILAGTGLTRLVRRGRVRAPVQAALIVTGVVGAFAFPLVRGYGLAAGNPSSLPHNYAANLAVVVAATWAVAGVCIVVRHRRTSTYP